MGKNCGSACSGPGRLKSQTVIDVSKVQLQELAKIEINEKNTITTLFDV